MRKNFGKKGMFTAPLPVLLVGTYDKDGVANLMNVAWGGQCSEHHVARWCKLIMWELCPD